MKRTIIAQSGHTLSVESIKFDDLPEYVKKFDYITEYNKHYVVRNWNRDGVVFFYMATDRVQGTVRSAKEIVVWYRKGGFWHSFGSTLQEAIDGAQKDGWLYA